MSALATAFNDRGAAVATSQPPCVNFNGTRADRFAKLLRPGDRLPQLKMILNT
jgi:hypothetical protein